MAGNKPWTREEREEASRKARERLQQKENLQMLVLQQASMIEELQRELVELREEVRGDQKIVARLEERVKSVPWEAERKGMVRAKYPTYGWKNRYWAEGEIHPVYSKVSAGELVPGHFEMVE